MFTFILCLLQTKISHYSKNTQYQHTQWNFDNKLSRIKNFKRTRDEFPFTSFIVTFKGRKKCPNCFFFSARWQYMHKKSNNDGNMLLTLYFKYLHVLLLYEQKFVLQRKHFWEGPSLIPSIKYHCDLIQRLAVWFTETSMAKIKSSMYL